MEKGMVAVVSTYSFDNEVVIKLCKSEEAAIAYLKQTFDEEVRIDTEECGYKTEATIDDDGYHAVIINHFDDHDNTTRLDITSDISELLDVHVQMPGRKEST